MNLLTNLILPYFQSSKAWILALLLIFTNASQAELLYSSNGSTITITGSDPKASGALVIPATINNLPVRSIGERAFYGYSGLTSVTIPNSVTEIGEWAFAECSEMLIKNLTSPTEGVKGSLTYKWDPIFLKGVNSRWQKAVKNCGQGKGELLLFDEFESVEILMAELVSQGNSAESIYSCMDAKT